jgi:cell division protein FtsW (lipid II flippase)/cell division protein FtsI/penicillin-binding protein 2
MNSNPKIRGLVFLLIVLLFSCVGFIRLFNIQNKAFADQNKAALNLNSEVPVPALAKALHRHGRIEDPEEAAFIAGYILSRMPKGKQLPSVSVLSVRNSDYDFSIALDSVGRASIKGKPYLEARLQAYDLSKGVCEISLSDIIASESLVGKGEGKHQSFKIKIQEKGRLPFVKKTVSDTVTLRITQHWREYSEPNEGGKRDCLARDSVYCYILASGGTATLSLPIKDPGGKEMYYSVLPIQRGYSFGSEQGTYKNLLGHMSFVRSRAFLMPLSNDIIRDIREQGDIMVRTPEQYKSSYFGMLIILISAWLAVFFFVLLRDVRLNKSSDYGLIVSVAGITMLGVLTLFSIPAHPLQDTMRATGQMTKGLIPGIIALILASLVDWTRVFERAGKAYENRENQGAVLAVIAVLLAATLFFFGSGPGGAKVNLGFFQGQPIIKYVLVVFMAIYFANRYNLIPAFASRDNKYDRIRHLKLVVKMITLLIILLVFQIAFLGDMGPGIVLALIAVSMYSVCRKDTLPMFVGAATFIMIAVLWKLVFGANGTIVLPIVWAVIWVVVCRSVKGQVYESAILVVIIISALLYGGQWLDAIGLHHMGDRLSQRVEIWQSPFDNRTPSDQLAMAIYEYAEGGLVGRTGKSMAYLVPAAHTDFIWASFVSHWGLVGGFLLLFLFAVLFRDGLNTAARSNNVFGFYLSFGLISSLAIQAIFLLGGTCDLWPLSGVPLFGMSYGSTSLVLDLAAVGVLISLSRDDNSQSDAWKGKGDAVKAQTILYLMCIVLLGLVALKTAVFSFLKRDDYLTKATIVQSLSGNRVQEYAPTIERFVKTGLKTGEIYDRKGVLLATNEKDGKRNYPAIDHTFFWTGNQNTMTLASRIDRYPAGVLADYRWDIALRGFDIHPERKYYISDKLRSPFLPETDIYRVDTLMTYNYSAVLPLWKSPRAAEEWNANSAERNITLTLDSHLQGAIIQAAEEFFDSKAAITTRTRFSIVIIDAKTGDVLTSACYPLPEEDRIRAMAEAHINVYRDDYSYKFQAFPDMDLACCYPTNPGSIIKLATAMAGFRKIGAGMAEHKEYVHPLETIYSHDPMGFVSLSVALGASSNNYFIRALNTLDLYEELRDIYWACGISFNNRRPYCLYPSDSHTDYATFKSDFQAAGKVGRKQYADYCASGQRHKMNSSAWSMAWGQGPVTCTPLAMARLIGAIANDGLLMDSRFRTDDPISVRDTILSADNARLLRANMRPLYNAAIDIKGKTGTPERQDRLSPTKKSNDAWWGGYVEGKMNPTSEHPLAIVLRFERTGGATSQLAVQFVKEKLMPVLQNEGYLSRL